MKMNFSLREVITPFHSMMLAKHDVISKNFDPSLDNDCESIYITKEGLKYPNIAAL